MNDNRIGGMLLVAGSVAGLLTMAAHPMASHGGLPSPHALAMIARLDRIAHGLAIASLPVFFLGAMALTRRLATSNRLALAALVAYGFAAVAILVAGAMSGFVGADILSRMVEGDPKLESRRMLLDYTFRINQAFASVYTVGSCVAIFLWSLAMAQTRRMPVGLSRYGLALGPIIVLGLFSGKLSLDVHGMGLVVLVQSIWFVASGCALMHSPDGADSGQKLPVPGTAN